MTLKEGEKWKCPWFQIILKRKKTHQKIGIQKLQLAWSYNIRNQNKVFDELLFRIV